MVSGCFLLGILALQGFAVVPSKQALFFISIVALAAVRRLRWLSYLLVGFVWASVCALHVIQLQLPENLEGKEILVQGRVVGLPHFNQRATQFLFEVSHVGLDGELKGFSGRIKLSWYGPAVDIKSAETWQLLVKLKRPHGTSNPHGFDYEKWLFQQKINATGYVRKSQNNKLLQRAEFWRLGALRQMLGRYLDEKLATNSHSAIIKALVLGDRNGITQQQWGVFRQTGTSHLIAISGLHIGLVSALVFASVRGVSLRVPRVRRLALELAVVMSLLAAMGYAGLAGFSIPTQRALIMLFVIMGAIFLERHYRPAQVISAALLSVLLIDPASALSIGFWLSFAAVAIILYGFIGRVGDSGQTNFFYKLIKTQWLVTLGLMPLVLYFFQQVSIVAPIANIVAVPLLSFLLIPSLMASLLLGVISERAAEYVLNFSADVLSVLWWFLEGVTQLGYVEWVLPSVSLLACSLALIGVLFLFLPKGFIPKPVALLLFIPLLFPQKIGPLQEGEFKLVMLDVGQGLSVVISTTEHTLLFDTGSSFEGSMDFASTVVLPYLRGQQKNKIDVLVVSHGDNDHAGGVDTVFENIRVDDYYSSESQNLIVNGKKCVDGVSWNWDGVAFEFLHPDTFDLYDGNNGSCVLRVSSRAGTALLPGDIEKHAEQSLVRHQRHRLSADVLIAPHHGSKTSSTDSFVDSVNPSVVLFPTGYKNRFNFPKAAVVERYKRAGVRPFNSAEHGAVTVNFNLDEKPKLVSYRDASTRYWNWKP
ncbi:MAG: MBL fold metallo-hydrolase [Cycloclasticus sp. symbiont of Poecilosclerida sp. M]|nr:MAG: MBL fold metallo-hydrolase [Cycloclasticus sp. symbiont of Poecilosclerida sp. M]